MLPLVTLHCSINYYFVIVFQFHLGSFRPRESFFGKARQGSVEVNIYGSVREATQWQWASRRLQSAGLFVERPFWDILGLIEVQGCVTIDHE